jgi:hypothetical protein
MLYLVCSLLGYAAEGREMLPISYSSFTPCPAQHVCCAQACDARQFDAWSCLSRVQDDYDHRGPHKYGCLWFLCDTSAQHSLAGYRHHAHLPFKFQHVAWEGAPEVGWKTGKFI